MYELYDHIKGYLVVGLGFILGLFSTHMRRKHKRQTEHEQRQDEHINRLYTKVQMMSEKQAILDERDKSMQRELKEWKVLVSDDFKEIKELLYKVLDKQE